MQPLLPMHHLRHPKNKLSSHHGLSVSFAFLFLMFIFFITRGNTPHSSELAYIDYSLSGKVTGSVVPASCDSNDWRGSYCGGALNTSACHASQTTSFCPADGFTCSYNSSSGLVHSGSHFNGDCTTMCPNDSAHSYDPYYDPNHTSCPPIVQLFFSQK